MRFCSIWQNVNHPFLQCVMPVSHLVADLIIRSTVMASSVLLFNSYAVMVEFLKHSVLICRMKTVLKSSITIIETEYLSGGLSSEPKSVKTSYVTLDKSCHQSVLQALGFLCDIPPCHR